MDSEIIARPSVTITDVIRSLNTESYRSQLLLIKRADEPLKGRWALPRTLLWSKESADAACIRLIDDKTGLQIPMNSTEQLVTLTNPKRVTGTRTLALAYMAHLSSTPKLYPEYRATDARWLVLDKDQGNHVITHDQQEIILSPVGHLVFDHIQIIITVTDWIKNKLDHQPQIPRTLSNTFTLRQACEVLTAFLGTTIDEVDNSNFKKTHNHFSKEVGATTLNHPGWPPELCQLN